MTSELMKKIEEDVALRFLKIYNTRNGCAFEIIQIGEAPDIYCEDKKSGEKLYLEISTHENLEGDIRKEFERLRGERYTLGNSLGQRGNIENILKNLRILLEKKLQASYSNSPTALVIGRVITIWSCREWQIFAVKMAQEVFQGKEQNYPKGVWIFCTTDDTTNEDILNLMEI